jgi:hypothetical protein
MKVLLCFVLVATASAISYNAKVIPDEITEENFQRIGRIASGNDALAGENLDFCYITIGFFQKTQTCGCTIWWKTWIVTSARCVYE